MSPAVTIEILILAIPFYFFSKWILKKLKLGNNRNRKYFAIIPTVIVSPLLYIGIITIWLYSISYYPKTTFDKQKWDEQIKERYKMSEDIMKSEILIGKNKAEVIELLGEYFYRYDENYISYYLGFVPGFFNFDPDVLDIYFKNGKAVSINQRNMREPPQ